MTELEQAIRIVEESRESHVEALRWLDRALSNPDPNKRVKARRLAYGDRSGIGTRIHFAFGGKLFHRECIREYDLVLRVLRRAAAQ